MDCAGEEGFSGAAFSGHEDGGAAVGDGFGEVEDFEHLVVVADYVFKAEAQIQLLAEGLIFEE